MSKKTVQFDYFEIWCEVEEGNSGKIKEKKFNLNAIFDKASRINSKDTTYPYRGEKARIQSVVFDENSSIWEVQLLRLREIAPPGLAKDDGSYEIFKLDDGEYIGESVSMLYDKINYVLCIQRNFNAIPPSGVEEYLNNCINKNPKIKLKPIIENKKGIEKINKNKIFRKMEIGLAMKDLDGIDTESGLGKTLNNLLKFGGTNVKIEISVGNAKRDRSLAPGLSEETINQLYKNVATTKLKANVRDVDDTKVEKIDLFDDRLKDLDIFDVDRGMPLTHERVYPRLRAKYLTRLENGEFK
ncbi:DUF6731 family protein [Clostridium senegalense]|uniref:DUF6731 family protein n=1 Tax=Clostridium senegalense TaxID=1465809 RepID=UPI000287B455|nr:DUF6731 family protein [Clostridium senegalense]